MKVEKIRNLTETELTHQERELNDQLFKLKFQLNMGQTESLKKIRGLRKDIARIKTIQREQALADGEEEVMNATTSEKQKGRKTLTGEVVSTKMAKTIVVEVHRQKAHPLYVRVVKRTKKFYAHDEEQTAHLGDVVRIEETRPLSKLKRWKLKEIVRRAAQVGELKEEAGDGRAS